MSRPPHRRNAGPTISRIGAMLVLLAGVWGAGLFRYADSIPTSISQPTYKTDAIVVLTGGRGRLDEGFRLLSQGFGARLLVSGVYKGVDVNVLRAATRQYSDREDCCIDTGYDAEDTIGNAIEARDWVLKHGFTNLRLVTSAYHMPRAILEFKHNLPDVDIIKHPVFTPEVKQERWWAWPGTTGLIVGEYNKFLMAWMRHRLMSIFSKDK